uniref:Uncharacterized protein n=1 Tax=Daphnia galeata TaxID=27404 RepID=A0A8J2W3A2_9CRUS|nr:unnamed protein product [Daphnia galeata]
MDSKDLLLTTDEWSILAGVAEILKPFDEVTTYLSSQYYPSISKTVVILSIRILQHNLGSMHFDASCTILAIFEMKSDLLDYISDRFNMTTESSTAHLVSTFLDPRLKKNRIYLSVGVGGGGETAEERVENELRQAIINKHLASSTNVAASSISSSQNSCKSFQDSMIEKANAVRNGEASDATTFVIINIRDYLKKPYLPWSTDPLSYWLAEKNLDSAPDDHRHLLGDSSSRFCPLSTTASTPPSGGGYYHQTITSQFLIAIEVSPLQQLSILRLELQEAVLGLRLSVAVITELSSIASQIVYWCHTQTVLQWIHLTSSNTMPWWHIDAQETGEGTSKRGQWSDVETLKSSSSECVSYYSKPTNQEGSMKNSSANHSLLFYGAMDSTNSNNPRWLFLTFPLHNF